jgi:hypothetical protein
MHQSQGKTSRSASPAGYKLRPTADAEEAPRLTSILISAANEHGGRTRGRQSTGARGSSPTAGDRRYRLRQHRVSQGGRQRSVEVLAPSTRPRRRVGRIPKVPLRSASSRAQSPIRGADDEMQRPDPKGASVLVKCTNRGRVARLRERAATERANSIFSRPRSVAVWRPS